MWRIIAFTQATDSNVNVPHSKSTNPHMSIILAHNQLRWEYQANYEMLCLKKKNQKQYPKLIELIETVDY